MAAEQAQPKNIPYHFHAHGHAFSAHFNRPADVPIAAQAATSLPSDGGFAHSKVEDFAVSRLASFKLGETHVSGSWQAHNIVTTSATAVLAGLNLLDFLTLDKLVARVTSEYVADKSSKEGQFSTLGSHFNNLRLGGFEVKVTLRHDLVLRSKNFKELADNLKRDRRPQTFIDDGAALCSLVEKIEVEPGLASLPGFKIEGHVLVVPHFGEIALGEVFATPGSVTLTMLKFKLGSPDGGGGSGGQGGTNGQPPPPIR